MLISQTGVIFLGFVISTTGISMDPEKLRTISEWPFPIDLKILHRFLGFLNYYRRFIKDFFGIAAPLTALTGKGIDTVKSLKNSEVHESFKKLN